MMVGKNTSPSSCRASRFRSKMPFCSCVGGIRFRQSRKHKRAREFDAAKSPKGRVESHAEVEEGVHTPFSRSTPLRTQIQSGNAGSMRLEYVVEKQVLVMSQQSEDFYSVASDEDWQSPLQDHSRVTDWASFASPIAYFNTSDPGHKLASGTLSPSVSTASTAPHNAQSSAVSSVSQSPHDSSGNRSESAATSEDGSQNSVAPCDCGYPCHTLVYSPEIPIMTGPDVRPDSYEEALIIATSLAGHWVTVLERSESLDAIYRMMGLNMMKRAVMNRLAVPLTLFLENSNTGLHGWVHTPLGVRHMNCDLTGAPFFDDDPDCGRWDGSAKVVDYSIPWFCNGRVVRALQQTRHNVKLNADAIETRCILPDAEFGKVMLFSFVMASRADPAKRLTADRILKYVSEKP